MNSSSKDKISIIHRINRLKLKAGAELTDDRAGFIDPLALYRSQRVIDEGAEQYDEELEAVLVKLDSSWADLMAAKDEKSVKRIRSQMFNYANNVKDLAETYGYTLMVHFSVSLREFSERVDPQSLPHQVIVQAHLDVMWVTFHQSIKTDESALAQELKDVVAKAISAHS
jgi:hypothetical protein